MVTTTPFIMVNARALTQLITIATTLAIITLLQTTQSIPIRPTLVPPPAMHPLCISQFALVNHACASLPTLTPPPVTAAPPPPPLPPSPPGHPLNASTIDKPSLHKGGGHRGYHVGHHGSHVGHHHHRHHHHHHHHRHQHEHESWHDHEHGYEHEHRHEHEHEHRHKHEHRHEHEHDHGHEHKVVVETQGQRDCCRWLQAVDHQCVCDVLVYLPVFLSKPAHKYTVVVDEGCQISYECPARKFG